LDRGTDAEQLEDNTETGTKREENNQNAGGGGVETAVVVDVVSVLGMDGIEASVIVAAGCGKVA